MTKPVIKDWIVTYYDINNRIIGKPFEIKDRTEHEASNEASVNLPENTEDWTMMPK